MLKVKMVCIPVKDQDRALKFYTEKLGCKVITDAPFEDQRWIEIQLPHSETNLVLFTMKGHEERIGTFSNIIFTSKDVHKTYDDLRKKGVEFVQPPKEEAWGISALFKDPDGNVFCIGSQ